MTISKQKLLELFPKDNRLIHFVRKKNGYFVRNDEEVEWIKHKAMVEIIKVHNSKKEFESEDHINYYVMRSIQNAFMSLWKYNEAQKRQGDERVESDLIYGEDESYNVYLRSAVTDDKTWLKDDMAYVMSVAEDVLDEQEQYILQLILQSKNYREISDLVNMSHQGVRQKHQRIIKKIKSYVSGTHKKNHENRDRKAVQDLREINRRKSARKEQEKRDNYRKVLALISTEETL